MDRDRNEYQKHETDPRGQNHLSQRQEGHVNQTEGISHIDEGSENPDQAVKAEDQHTLLVPTTPRRSTRVSSLSPFTTGNGGQQSLPMIPHQSTQLQSNGHSEHGPPRQNRPDSLGQLDSLGFPCAKPGCDKHCNLWDGSSVMCARCGPFSEIRYCGINHLYEDVKMHWLVCGKKAFEYLYWEDSVFSFFREVPPLILSRHNWDSPERHRQVSLKLAVFANCL